MLPVKEAHEDLPTLSKAKASAIRKLRQAKERQATGRFLIEGVRVAEEAVAARAALDHAVVSPRLLSSERGRVLQDNLSLAGVPLAHVSDRELDTLADTEAPQGVLLVASEADRELSSLEPEDGVLVLDGIQDPGNVGTLVRSAWAFGCGGVIALDGSADPFGAKAVRASAGGIFHVGVVRSAAAEVLQWSQAQAALLLTADSGEGQRPLPPSGPWVLVVGSEGHGVRPELRAAGRAVSVAMPGGAESLNAAVAGSLLLYALTDASSDNTKRSELQ